MKQIVKYILFSAIALAMVACGSSSKNEDKGTPQYTVTVDYNDGSPVQSYVVTEGDNFTLPAGEPVRSGYYFLGWSDGDGIYDPGEQYEVWGNTAFVAQWYGLSEFTVTLEYDNGEPRQRYAVQEDTEITLPDAPEKEHYYFMWWSDGTDTFNPGEQYMVQDNVTFTAIWEPVPLYNITIKYDDGITPDNITQAYEYDEIILPPEPSKPGYYFMWWSDGTNGYVENEEYMVEDNVTFTAIWSTIPVFTVTIVYDNGIPDNITRVSEYEEITLPPEPSKPGYYFMWWSDGANDYVENEVYMVEDNVTITAIWSTIPVFAVTIVYDNGTPNRQLNVQEYDEITLPPEPVKPGYYFMWWSDGTDTFDPGELYMIEDNTTFTAIWEPVPLYTVTIKYDNGTPDTITQAYEYEEITLPPEPHKDGYYFMWWSDGANDYVENEVYMVEDNVTITAIWEIETFTVTFDADGGVLNGANSYTYHYGERLDNQTMPTAVKNGVTNVGWMEGDGNIHSNSSLVTYDMDLYAKYLAGSGTDDDPYVVSNDAALAMLSEDSEASYILTGDITLTGTWVPFYFAGKLDGDNHKIDGLEIPVAAGADDAGLFDFTENAVISNLIVITSAAGINGSGSTGIIAGYSDNTAFINVTTSGVVNGDSAGGIAGFMDNASHIDNSSSSATVNGSNAGGLAGHLYDRSRIIRSSSSSVVTGDNAGGLAGYIDEDSYIAVSLSSAAVSGRIAGGLAGFVYKGVISDSYATGNVSGTDPDENILGGIAGSLEEGDIRNCYATGDVIDNPAVTGESELGGIAGNLYVETFVASMFKGNVAINTNITTRDDADGGGTVGRVIGYNDTGLPIADTYAWEGITVTGHTDDIGINGASVQIGTLTTQGFYTGIQWQFGDSDAGPWKWDAAINGGLPYLYWE